ncbi:MAG: hypothetical protein FWD36_00500 [Treponema sp.]|nr:hypothetical protein [Treponema sp.]
MKKIAIAALIMAALVVFAACPGPNYEVKQSYFGYYTVTIEQPAIGGTFKVDSSAAPNGSLITVLPNSNDISWEVDYILVNGAAIQGSQFTLFGNSVVTGFFSGGPGPFTVTEGIVGGTGGTLTFAVNGVPLDSGDEANKGQVITVTAIPDPDYILEWVSVYGVPRNPVSPDVYEFTLLNNTTVMAAFKLDDGMYTVTVRQPDAGGTVSVAIDGNSSTTILDGARDDLVTITATPDDADWELDYIAVNGVRLGSGVNTFTLTANATVAAFFKPVVVINVDGPFNLTVIPPPTGSGMVRVSIDGGGEYSLTGYDDVPKNTIVTFFLSPPSQHSTKWVLVNDEILETDPTHGDYRFNLTRDTTVTALFTPTPINTNQQVMVRVVSLTPEGGTIMASVDGIQIEPRMDKGVDIVLLPEPVPGYKLEWIKVNDDELDPDAEGVYQFTLEDSTIISALFVPLFTVTVIPPSVGGTISAVPTTGRHEQVTVTAAAAAGYDIDWVSVDGEPVDLDNNNQYQFQLTANAVVMGGFKLQASTFAVTVIPPIGGGGTVSVSPGAGQSGQRIVITPLIDQGFRLDSILVNGALELPDDDGVYSFTLTTDTLVTSSFSINSPRVIFSGGFNNGILGGETEFEKGDTVPPIDTWLLPQNSLAPGAGVGGRGAAIKVAFTSVSDYFGLKITLDDPLNMQDVQWLSLYVRSSYQYTGAVTESYFRPAINSVVFGDYDETLAEPDWVKSVWYAGELNNGDGIQLGPNYREILVPVPKAIDHEINTVMLYFAPRQLYVANPNLPPQTFEIFIDQIRFMEGGAVLEQVWLPEDLETSPYRPTVPYRLNGGSTTFATCAHVLTMDTRLVYRIGTSSVSLFGKDGDPEVTRFYNRFTDFFVNPGDIVYNVVGGGLTVNNGTHTITPTGPGGGVLSGAVHRLVATYDGVASENSMEFRVLGLPQTPVGGTMLIDDFANVPVLASGHVQSPYFWGGWAGDSQSRGTPPILFGYVDDLMRSPSYVDSGRQRDDWYELGTWGLNHDLSTLTTITVNMALNVGVKYTFGLESGYPGVASTLVGNKADGGKFSHTVTLTGRGFSSQAYVLQLSDFRNAGVNLSCVTGYTFFTEGAGLNTGLPVGAFDGSEFFIEVHSITAE